MASNEHVVLFHSAYGLRPAVVDFADRLRSAGHRVDTPDLYDGDVFDDREGAAAKMQQLGFDEILVRAGNAVRELPANVLYAGFSNGGICAELLAATRLRARGAILMHAPLMVRDLGWQTWPAGVPVQVHFGLRDPIRMEKPILELKARVEKSGCRFELHNYDVAGHLFSDPGFPAYNQAAAHLMAQRVLTFLQEL